MSTPYNPGDQRPTDPYGQSGAGTNPYGQPSSGNDPYAQPPSYTQNANPYGQPSAGSDPYAQPSAQDPYAQQTYQQPVTDPYGAQPSGQPYAQQGYGDPAYGQQPYGQGYPEPYGPFGESTNGYSEAHPERPHVGFGQAVKAFFANYATFKGRASRSEFWWFFLLSFLVAFVLSMITNTVGTDFVDGDGSPHYNAVGTITTGLSGLWSLATLIPGLALSFRRLHDTGRSAWWLLIGLIPLIGEIVLIVFYAQPGKPEGVRFDDPSGKQPTPVPAQATRSGGALAQY